MLSINDISVRIAGRLLIDQSTVQVVPGAHCVLHVPTPAPPHRS